MKFVRVSYIRINLTFFSVFLMNYALVAQTKNWKSRFINKLSALTKCMRFTTNTTQKLVKPHNYKNCTVVVQVSRNVISNAVTLRQRSKDILLCVQM